MHSKFHERLVTGAAGSRLHETFAMRTIDAVTFALFRMSLWMRPTLNGDWNILNEIFESCLNHYE